MIDIRPLVFLKFCVSIEQDDILRALTFHVTLSSMLADENDVVSLQLNASETIVSQVRLLALHADQ
jgi:hypothetical protein